MEVHTSTDGSRRWSDDFLSVTDRHTRNTTYPLCANVFVGSRKAVASCVVSGNSVFVADASPLLLLRLTNPQTLRVWSYHVVSMRPKKVFD